MKKTYFSLLFCQFCLFTFSQVPTLGLQAYWPFDGSAKDSSGNGNHGTVYGATLSADRFGNPNRAYAFNGINSHIDVLNSATVDIPNNQDFSIAFWIKTNSANNNGIPMIKSTYGSQNGYIFFAENTNSGYCNTSGQLSFYVAASSGADACANSPICNDNANWYFITGMHKSSINKTYLYVNGVLQSDVGSKFGTTNNLKNLYFGACYTGTSFIQFFNGYLDCVRIYNRNLTQNEIDNLYNEVNPTDGIEENNLFFENMSLFPSPNNGKEMHLTFTSKIQEKAIIQIIDNIGNIVLVDREDIFIGKNEVQFNTENLANGFYYLNVLSGNYSQNIKFIKK
jgi:hypothetical protein